MKLIVEIEAPESEIREAVEGIPPSFLRNPGYSPVRLLALALKKAYEKHVASEANHG
jgi:hypothetical protein